MTLKLTLDTLTIFQYNRCLFLGLYVSVPEEPVSFLGTVPVSDHETTFSQNLALLIYHMLGPLNNILKSYYKDLHTVDTAKKV